MKPEYGPTLGQLLAPRWHAASLLVRAPIIAAGAGLVVAIVALVLTLENATFSHGGKVPFSFSYRDLYRVRADPGGYVKVQARSSDGALRYSYAVDPLRLPPYSGGVSGELPLYAVAYIRGLSQRDRDFVLRGEEKTTAIATVPGYEVLYTAEVEGRKMFGRNVLLLPERPGVREGVQVVMLAPAPASSRVTSPTEIASTGVLERPLTTFTFG